MGGARFHRPTRGHAGRSDSPYQRGWRGAGRRAMILAAWTVRVAPVKAPRPSLQATRATGIRRGHGSEKETAMVKLWHKDYSRAELLQRVGRLEQVGGVEAYRLDDGPEQGVRALHLRGGPGLP